MSALADRLRRAAAGLGQVLGGRRPGVELVRVDQPELLAPPAPQPLPALPAPPHPICPRCRTRHEPRPIPRRGGSGAAGLYGPSLLPDPNRPRPLSQSPDADLSSLIRNRSNPWRS
jgi:hypothetical protein